MNNIYLSEMQEKEIISTISGTSYGKIVDALVDSNGQIISFVVENKKMFKNPFRGENLTFTYSDIDKIGKDVILVRV